MKGRQGFTLLELLVVIGIIAILAGIVIVALNPARQFSQARNATRSNDVRQILNAIHQNRIDNNGVWTCAAGALPVVATNMASGVGNYDVCGCIVPTYIPSEPLDPQTGTGVTNCSAAYDTQYNVSQDAAGRVTIAAPDAELAETISVTL